MALTRKPRSEPAKASTEPPPNAARICSPSTVLPDVGGEGGEPAAKVPRRKTRKRDSRIGRLKSLTDRDVGVSLRRAIPGQFCFNIFRFLCAFLPSFCGGTRRWIYGYSRNFPHCPGQIGIDRYASRTGKIPKNPKKKKNPQDSQPAEKRKGSSLRSSGEYHPGEPPGRMRTWGNREVGGVRV